MPDNNIIRRIVEVRLLHPETRQQLEVFKTVEEVAEMFKVQPPTIRRWAYQNKIKHGYAFELLYDDGTTERRINKDRPTPVNHAPHKPIILPDRGKLKNGQPRGSLWAIIGEDYPTDPRVIK